MTQTIEQLQARVRELEDQLAAAQEALSVAECDLLSYEDRNKELHDQLSTAEQRVVRQYYFKNNSCKAESAHDPDCICWHDEGTGPMQPLPDGTYPVQMTWRKFVKDV